MENQSKVNSVTPKPIVMVCTSDLAGQVRGKGFPASALPARMTDGIGWTPTNSMITALGPIAEGPWGAFGDLVLLPDPATEVHLQFAPTEPEFHYFLGDIAETTGKPWSCCPRQFLKRAIADLAAETELQLHCAFEHEFMFLDAASAANHAYNLEAFAGNAQFAELLSGALEAAGIEPESFMPEYANKQFEVTCKPSDALTAADRAVAIRQVTKATARHLGGRASFAPIRDPDGVGNGVHVHFSLRDQSGEPVNYDPEKPYGLGVILGAFAAGVQRHMHALVALTAPSPVSYLRLVPNRWSAVYNNVGYRDREAALRICPVDERFPENNQQTYNLEYRAADAAATPHLVLGALIYAGLDGIRSQWEAPPVTETDPTAMSGKDRIRFGISLLPRTLNRALDAFEASTAMTDWMGPALKSAYLAHKRFEVGLVTEKDAFQQCEMYADVY